MILLYRELFCFTIVFTLFLGIQCSTSLAGQPSHPTAPTHYITLEFDLQSHTLSADSRIELPAEVSIQLELSHLHVSQIIVNGRQVETEQGSNNLDVASAPKEQEIFISYSRKIPPGSTPFSTISEYGIALAEGWYPMADQEMFFRLTAYIPVGFEAVSEADEIIAFQENDKKQVTFRFPHPLFSINFVAGPYKVTEESFGEGKTLVAYFFAEDQELAAGYLEKARQYLDRYEEMLGPYPYERFAIVENRLPTGFAMPTFTLLGQSVVRLPFIVDTSLGHEVLHAWFGNGIRMSHQEGNWVEGLTTYLADHSFAADKGQDDVYRKAQLVKYQSYVRPEMELNLRNFSNVGHGHSKGQPVRAVGYNKSSMFFHMLREKVGADVFTASLRDFYERLKFKTAGWSDLQASFESTSGMDLDDFFNQWLDRNDVPVIAVMQPEIRHHEGHPLLSFNIVQKNDTPYMLEVPIIIKTPTEEIRKTLLVADHRSAFEILLDSIPEALVIDPDYDMMRSLAPGELPPTWSRFLGSPAKIAILATEQHRTVYKSLLEKLTDSEVRVVLQDEATDQDLAENSLLFLDTDGSLSRSLFALPDHPANGFTLDVRDNPLNPEHVAVLVSAPNAEQVELAAAKLSHYKKYSSLYFKDGRIQEKSIKETESGLQIELVSLPPGIETSRTRAFEDIIAKLLNYQVIYIGESHTSYEDHQLQLEIIRALHRHDPRLTIGMEMFTRPTQPVIDQYIADKMDEKGFLKESHYFQAWRFDYRLYRDIINFAKHNHLQILALNLQKDIVSQVFKNGGPNSLAEDDANLVPADRKLDVPGYRERIGTAFRMHAGQGQGGDFSGFLQAQALWDETMAETIAEYLQTNPDERLVIIAGRGHVDRINGIPPRVARRLPVSQAVVINSIGSPGESETADFIFFSPPANLSPFPLLGVILEDIDEGDGVLVTALNPQGQAKEAGIREKDIILAIDSETVNDIEDIKIAMLYKEKSDAVMVRIKRRKFPFGDKIVEIEVPLKSPGTPHHM